MNGLLPAVWHSDARNGATLTFFALEVTPEVTPEVRAVVKQSYQVLAKGGDA